MILNNRKSRSTPYRIVFVPRGHPVTRYRRRLLDDVSLCKKELEEEGEGEETDVATQVGKEAVDQLARLLDELYGEESFTAVDLRRDFSARNMNVDTLEELLDQLVEDGWVATMDMVTFWTL